MTKAGERLLKGAEQALAYAQGRAKADAFRVHNPEAQKIASTTEPVILEVTAPKAQDKREQNGNIAKECSSE